MEKYNQYSYGYIKKLIFAGQDAAKKVKRLKNFALILTIMIQSGLLLGWGLKIRILFREKSGNFTGSENRT